MELIHNSTLSKLDELSQRFFWMNKKIDRMKSVLDVSFTMPILAGLVHEKLAHMYPLLADKVSDIQEMFNYDANYLGVEAATEYYDSVQEMMEKLYEWTLETNNLIREAANVALSEGDFNVYTRLLDIADEYSNYVSNAILLRDKAEGYGDELMSMDKDSKKWWNL